MCMWRTHTLSLSLARSDYSDMTLRSRISANRASKWVARVSRRTSSRDTEKAITDNDSAFSLKRVFTLIHFFVRVLCKFQSEYFVSFLVCFITFFPIMWLNLRHIWTYRKYPCWAVRNPVSYSEGPVYRFVPGSLFSCLKGFVVVLISFRPWKKASETLVSVYQTGRRYKPQDGHLRF